MAMLLLSAMCLLSGDVDIDAVNIAGYTALSMAASSGFNTTVRMLLEHGAAIEYATKRLHCHLPGGARWAH